MKPTKLCAAVLLFCLAASARLLGAHGLSGSPPPRLVAFDPSLEARVRELGGPPQEAASGWLEIFPRRRVPQVRRLVEPGAVFMAVNVRELALLPGDRLVVKDASNDTVVIVSATNQSVVRRSAQRRGLWRHPLLTFGDRVTLEYWPSLRTLALPIDRPQRDNAVLVVDSYGFALWRGHRRSPGGDDDEDDALESQVGATNEMKPAVCYKTTQPEWYNKSRSVARLIIQQQPSSIEASSGYAAVVDNASADAVGASDPRDTPQEARDAPVSGGSYTLCTGWLVGRGGHLLTNHHCLFELTGQLPGARPWIQSARLRSLSNTNTTIVDTPRPLNDTKGNKTGRSSTTQRRQVSVNFMAEAASCDVTTSGRRGRLGERAGEIDATTVEILVANQALDYCLLKIVPSNTTTNGSVTGESLAKKFGYLTLRESGPVDGEPVYIPQHPNGETKTIASTKDSKPAVIRVATASYNATRRRRPRWDSDANVTDSDAMSVRYNADTAPGSSGSPVISQRDNTVVALHHAGTGSTRSGGSGGSSSSGWFSRLVDLVYARRGGGISNDGSDASSAATASEDEWNVGIRIDAIVADLRKRRMLPPCAVATKCRNSNSTKQARAVASRQPSSS